VRMEGGRPKPRRGIIGEGCNPKKLWKAPRPQTIGTVAVTL
jgi:hypothetical protein